MNPKTILIVEDELDMRIFLKTVMETSGYQPILARNGNDGFEKAKDIHPDLILLDVMMPGEGGVTMYRQLKTDDRLRDIPVVMLSAVEEATYGHYIKMLNIQTEGPIPPPNAYVEKPPDPDELLKVIGDLLV